MISFNNIQHDMIGFQKETKEFTIAISSAYDASNKETFKSLCCLIVDAVKIIRASQETEVVKLRKMSYFSCCLLKNEKISEIAGQILLKLSQNIECTPLTRDMRYEISFESTPTSSSSSSSSSSSQEFTIENNNLDVIDENDNDSDSVANSDFAPELPRTKMITLKEFERTVSSDRGKLKRKIEKETVSLKKAGENHIDQLIVKKKATWEASILEQAEKIKQVEIAKIIERVDQAAAQKIAQLDEKAAMDKEKFITLLHARIDAQAKAQLEAFNKSVKENRAKFI